MEDFVELRKIIAKVFSWWWLIILSVAVMAFVGYSYSIRQTSVYEATITLIVGETIQNSLIDRNDVQTSQMLALTYAEMVRRQPVLQGVVESLNMDRPWQSLKSRVSVKPIDGTQLIEIVAKWDDPEKARLVADEVARQLILLSPSNLQDEAELDNTDFVRQRLKLLQTKISFGQSQIQELEQLMIESNSVNDIRQTQEDINALEKLITDWENNYTQLLSLTEEKKSANLLAVIEPAQANANPVSPRVNLNVILASIVGFVLALAFIFLFELLDDRLKTVDEVSIALALPGLGSISRISGKEDHNRLLNAQEPFASVQESYRIIRSNLQFMSVDKSMKCIMVTSATQGEGKSITAANLGIVMAQAGLKTVIVDADMRSPDQHNIFQLSPAGGLAQALHSPELPVSSQLMNTKIRNLQILPCRYSPPNPAELLGSQRMENLLESLKDMADIVICDSPATLPVTDTVILSRLVDGVVLVVKAGRQRRDPAKQAMARLQNVGANMLGVILNQTPKADDYSSRGYYTTSDDYASSRRKGKKQAKPAAMPVVTKQVPDDQQAAAESAKYETRF